eukprot:XP_019922115.1 PREDICTED: uncharacterized protein LOC109618563 [Crassostrea gigas]
MTSKLRAVRSGQRSAVTRLLRTLEKSILEENNSEDTETIIAILEENQDTLEKLNSQILQELSSEEEIQMENRDSVEYMFHLRLRLAELTKSASSTKTLENVHLSTSINLNVNAQEFAQCNDMSQGNPGNPKTHYTVDKKDEDYIWDLQLLRRAVKVEPCIPDAGQVTNLRSSQESQEFIPAANLVAGSSHKKINKPQKICKKTHHTSICYKSQFLKPSSKSSVKNLERTKETESLLLEQSIQLHYSKQLNGDRCKEEEKVSTSKETNKLNTKLQKRETTETRTNQTKKSAFNTVDNEEKEDQKYGGKA